MDLEQGAGNPGGSAAPRPPVRVKVCVCGWGGGGSAAHHARCVICLGYDQVELVARRRHDSERPLQHVAAGAL
eukprot:354995-Chlamydomonas_euryale.AAC.1